MKNSEKIKLQNQLDKGEVKMEDIQDANLSQNLIQNPVQDNKDNLLKKQPKRIYILQSLTIGLVLLY